MAELATLARPYAKALFELALDQDQLDSWSGQLSTLSQVSEEEKVEQYLSSPSLTAGQQAQMLIDVCGDAITEEGQNLVRVLSENYRLELLSEITLQFEQLKSQRRHTIDVNVASAYALTKQQESNLVKALAKRFDCDVSINVVIDQTLIGGVVIHAGDTVIDDSVSGKLKKLAEAMNS